MTDKPITWDSIPSLELISDHKSSKPSDKRICIRLSASDLNNILHEQKDVIPVIVSAPGHGLLEGLVADLSHSGAKFYLPEAVDKGARTKFGITLGGRKIIADGIVKRINKRSNFFEIGIEFVNLSPIDRSFLADIISTKLVK